MTSLMVAYFSPPLYTHATATTWTEIWRCDSPSSGGKTTVPTTDILITVFPAASGKWIFSFSEDERECAFYTSKKYFYSACDCLHAEPPFYCINFLISLIGLSSLPSKISSKLCHDLPMRWSVILFCGKL